jgi:deoxyribodipyrimidine photo-lyase
VWTRGEDGARERLYAFLDSGAEGYAAGRDRPDQEHVSRLSPHLRFGEISPRQVWHAMRAAAERKRPPGARDREKFIAELYWREFCHHLLHHFPDLATKNFQPRFDRFPWRKDSKALKAWQRGETGYPLVDAGMRQLWRTGWMHNRVRMVCASFLVKHLLIDWRAGERWFWDTLVDADPANNPANWQWVAGSGADAAPYFRIFNPTTQGETFDPRGRYVRAFVPELAEVPDNEIHAPAKAPAGTLAAAGLRLGRDYPAPIVDHAAARARALEAFAKTRE